MTDRQRQATMRTVERIHVWLDVEDFNFHHSKIGYNESGLCH